jgi:hypothetical protein
VLSVPWQHGCIVGSGDKACGEHQRRIDGESVLYCACEPGYVLDTATGLGCKPCGDNEEVVQDKCVCKAGFARGSAADDCRPSALGTACAQDADCAQDVPFCTDGYCTAACTSSSGCERGFLCDRRDDRELCVKAPDGYGKSCSSAADCTDTAATFCDTFQTHGCLVECSKSKPCPGDWSCCNITLANLVLCVEPGGLTDGACPLGGSLVTP